MLSVKTQIDNRFPAVNKKILFIFAGENNAGGKVPNASGVPRELNPRPCLPIYNVETSGFEPLNIGENNNMDHIGLRSSTHGWELQLANSLEEDPYVDGYLVQTAQGNSVASEWGSGIYVDKRNVRVNKALELENFDNVVWWYMQGETDADNLVSKDAWKSGTLSVIDDMIELVPDSKVIIGKLPFLDTSAKQVAQSGYNTAIDEIVEDRWYVTSIETSAYSMQDSEYFDYQGMKDMSKGFYNETKKRLSFPVAYDDLVVVLPGEVSIVNVSVNDDRPKQIDWNSVKYRNVSQYITTLKSEGDGRFSIALSPDVPAEDHSFQYSIRSYSGETSNFATVVVRVGQPVSTVSTDTLDPFSTDIIGTSLAFLGNIANFPMVGDRKQILRFYCERAGAVKDFTWWWRSGLAGIIAPPYGYSAGDGGEYLVELQGDTVDGEPDGVTLDQFTFLLDLENFPPTNSNNSFRSNDFENNYEVSEGTYYNLVFTNISDAPFQNFVSLNGVFSRKKGDMSDIWPLDYYKQEINEINVNGFKRGSGTFTYRPQWGINFLDGSPGIGHPFIYAEAYSNKPQVNNAVNIRQDLIVEETFSVDKLFFYCTKVSGDQKLRVRLQKDGVTINEYYVNASDTTEIIPELPIPDLLDPAGNPYFSGQNNDYEAYGWVGFSLGVITQFEAGSTYSIIFSSIDSDSIYYIPAIFKIGYSAIDWRNLANQGSAYYSEDAGSTWSLMKVAYSDPTPNAVFPVFITKTS